MKRIVLFAFLVWPTVAWAQTTDRLDLPRIGASTDNAIPRWDGTLGARLKDSGWTINNSNRLTGPVDGVLRCVGDPRPGLGGQPYLTQTSPDNPGLQTNGAISINGDAGDPVPITLLDITEPTFMLAIGSDVAAPAIVCRTFV
jgi:hypothetical protein